MPRIAIWSGLLIFFLGCAVATASHSPLLAWGAMLLGIFAGGYLDEALEQRDERRRVRRADNVSGAARPMGEGAATTALSPRSKPRPGYGDGGQALAWRCPAHPHLYPTRKVTAAVTEAWCTACERYVVEYYPRIDRYEPEPPPPRPRAAPPPDLAATELLTGDAATVPTAGVRS